MAELLKTMQEIMITQIGSLTSQMEAKADINLKEISADQDS